MDRILGAGQTPLAASQGAALSSHCPAPGTRLSALLLPGLRALLAYVGLKGPQRGETFCGLFVVPFLHAAAAGMALACWCHHCAMVFVQGRPQANPANLLPRADTTHQQMHSCGSRTEPSPWAECWEGAKHLCPNCCSCGSEYPARPPFQSGSQGLLCLPTSGSFMVGLKRPFS